jgi:hypothetical protein
LYLTIDVIRLRRSPVECAGDFMLQAFAVVLFVVLGLFSAPAALHAQEHFGCFQGELIVKALPRAATYS